MVGYVSGNDRFIPKERNLVRRGGGNASVLSNTHNERRRVSPASHPGIYNQISFIKCPRLHVYS